MSLSLNTQSLFWIIGAAALMVVFVYWAYNQLKLQLTRQADWTLTLSRIAAAGMLLFLICEPIATLMIQRSQRGSILVLLDTSSSMNLTDGSGNRLQIVTDLITSEWYERLSEQFRVSTFEFAESVTPFASSEFDSLTARPAATDLGLAVEFMRQEALREGVSGLVLISDGNHTIGRDPVSAASGMKMPIYTLGVGDTLEVKDTAVVGHVTNDVAYIDSRIPVQVTVQSRGFAGTTVAITLTEDGRTVDSTDIVLSDGGREQSVTLYAVPSVDGVRQYSVTIPDQAGEAVLQNNSRSFSMKVLKTKLSVLYIEGSPRADLTFLKQTLLRDPNVELTSVISSPDGSFYPTSLPDQRSDWLTYDLVILGSIPFTRIQPWGAHIVHFVEQKGGGLIALGGPKSFELGGYGGTPVGNMMPVVIPAISRGLLEGLYLPTLTADGKAHALTRLHDSANASAQRWTELPPLTGINQVGPAKPGATVLAVHPTWKIGGSDAPVLAVHRYGLGKVLSIATYDLWRWDLMMWGGGGTNADYVRFWSNAVRWLTTREGNKRLRISSEKSVFGNGEPVTFAGQLHDDTFRPIENADVRVTIMSQADQTRKIALMMTSSSKGSGRYQSMIRHLEAGKYIFTAEAIKDGQIIGTDAGGFEIGDSAQEYVRTGMNRELLTRLSEKTGGKFYPINESQKMISEMEVPDVQIAETTDIRIWDHPFSLILLVAVLSMEWFIRRRHGLT